MKQPKKEHIIRRLLWEARPIWKWLLLAALLCIGVIVCGVLGPKLLGGLIDRLYAWWDGSDRSDLLAGLLRPMGWLALVYLGYSLFSYVKMQPLNRVVSRYFTCELRIRISDKIRRLPVSDVDQTPVGDILSRMMDDVSTMGNYVHQIIDTLMTGFFMILAIAVMMLLEDWRLAAIVLVLTPASILLSTLLSSRSEKHFYSMFTESGNLNAVTEEAFTNFATTKAYNLEEYTEQRHAELNERRRDKQPLDLPSAGSAFKRPEGHYAAALIDEAGLKGFSVGGAQVSEKHAGFIVNTGNATSADIHELMKQVRKRVYDNSQVLLEPEIILLPPDYKLEDRGPQVPRNKFIGLEEMTGGPDGGSAPDAE